MNQHPPRLAQTGFSLMELLIVIIIVGVLAAIGMPAYQDYSRATKRTAATKTLLTIAQQQERFFTDNNRYAANATVLGYQVANPETDGGYWQVTVNGDAATYSIQAVPANGHRDEDCTSLTLDNTGTQTSTGTGNKDCWGGR